MFKDYLEKYRETITENNPNNGICFDGAVDRNCYFAREKRLMLLLKETNGNKNNGEKNEILGDWDYMKWVHDQANQKESLYRSVFRNIAMWARMFEIYIDEGREPAISEVIDENGLIIDRTLCESMLGIAIVNLKKSWGVEQTDWNKMKEYIDSDSKRKEILLHQFDVLKPSVVFCGGTFDFAKIVFDPKCCIKEIESLDGQKIKSFEYGTAIFVDCYHPSRPGWSRENSFIYANNIFKAILL